MSVEIDAVCDFCGNEGESYDDGENFERVNFGHHGPSTKCLDCGRTF